MEVQKQIRKRRLIPNLTRKSPSLEEIVRKSFKETFYEYMTESSIAGFRYLVEPGRFKIERIIWLLVLCYAMFNITKTIKDILDDFYDKPIIEYLQENQYEIWKVPFPSVAICNINKISKKRAIKYAQQLSTNGVFSFDHVISRLAYLGRNIDHDIEGQEEYVPLLNILQWHDSIMGIPIGTFERMKMLSPTCEEMFVRCSWMGELRNCNELFQMRRTSEGFCCTFNYFKSYDDNGKYENSQYYTLAGPTTFMGLSIVVNPHLEDYHYTLRSSEGLNIMFFQPYDYPDTMTGGLIERFAPINSEVYFSISPRTVKSIPAIKNVGIKRRGCMFKEDNYELFKGLYSYSNCIVHCKIKTIKSLCKCTPFYLPTIDNDTIVCNLENIPCLHKYRIKFRSVLGADFTKSIEAKIDHEGFEEPDDGMRCNNCYPDCSNTKYAIQTAFVPFNTNRSRTGFLADLDVTNHSVINIFYPEIDSDLYYMDVRFGFIEIIGFIGGTCGLFMGFSVISVVEFLYYFTIKFVCTILRNRYK